MPLTDAKNGRDAGFNSSRLIIVGSNIIDKVFIK